MRKKKKNVRNGYSYSYTYSYALALCSEEHDEREHAETFKKDTHQGATEATLCLDVDALLLLRACRDVCKCVRV